MLAESHGLSIIHHQSAPPLMANVIFTPIDSYSCTGQSKVRPQNISQDPRFPGSGQDPSLHVSCTDQGKLSSQAPLNISRCFHKNRQAKQCMDFINTPQTQGESQQQIREEAQGHKAVNLVSSAAPRRRTCLSKLLLNIISTLNMCDRNHLTVSSHKCRPKGCFFPARHMLSTWRRSGIFLTGNHLNLS